MSHECLHAIHAADLLQLGLKRHRASVALHGAQTGHLHGLERRRIHQLLHGAVLKSLLDAPGNIDSRQFVLVPGPEAECDKQHSDNGRKQHIAKIPATFHAYTCMDSIHRANRRTFAAKRTIHSIDSASLAVRDIDAIRTMLVADSAMGTFRIILHDMEHLQLRLPAENLQQVAGHTERSQKNPPRDIDTHQAEHIIRCRENDYPHPEFQ